MKQRPLRARDLVADNHGRDAIAVERVPTPSKAWLDRQTDARLRRCSRARWWSLIPLTGGATIAPERHTVLLREAGPDDVRLAAACAMPAGVTLLLKLFPELETQPFILGRSLLAKSPTHSLRHRLGRSEHAPLEPQLRRAEMVLVALVERAVVTPSASEARAALQDALVGLNGVLGAGVEPPLGMRVDERERTIAFLSEVAQVAGLEPDTSRRLIAERCTW